MTFYNSKIPKLLNTEGVTIFPLIFISHRKRSCPKWLLLHENVHIKQQKKWLVIPFFVIYLYDYCYWRIKGMDHDRAYRNIRFEKEAYDLYSPPE